MAVWCILIAGSTKAQTTQTYIGLENLPEDIRNDFLLKEDFTNLTDSLFVAGQYDSLIAVAGRSLDNEKLYGRAYSNLIAAKRNLLRSPVLVWPCWICILMINGSGVTV